MLVWIDCGAGRAGYACEVQNAAEAAELCREHDRLHNIGEPHTWYYRAVATPNTADGAECSMCVEGTAHKHVTCACGGTLVGQLARVSHGWAICRDMDSAAITTLAASGRRAAVFCPYCGTRCASVDDEVDHIREAH